MEFRTYASNETTALVKRLLTAQTEASAQHLRALRDALDASVRSLEESEAPVADDVQELVKKLTNATAGAVKNATQRARDEAQKLVEAARAELTAVRADLDTARADLESERTQSANLVISLEKSESELNSIRAELRGESDRADALQRDLAALLDTHKQLEIAHLESQAACAGEAQGKAAVEDELREARALLDAAFEDSARVGEQLKVQITLTSSLQTELAEAQSHVEAALSTAEAATAREAELKASFENELQDLRGALDAALAEDARLGAQLEVGAAEKGKLVAALSGAQGELQMANEQRDAIASQLKASNARVQSLERSQAKHEETVKKLQAKLDALVDAEKRGRDQSASDDQESVGIRAENTMLRGELDRLETLFDVSLRGLNELGKAATVNELLSVLVKQLSTGFSRVALFRVKSNRLEGEYQVGFDQTTDVTKVIMPLNVESPLTRVVTSGEVETLKSGELEDGRGVPFGGTSAPAIALPIVLQDETLAVVYADHEGQPVSAIGPAVHESSARFAKLLVRQAIVLLMRMTHELKTLTELREYAALLIQEAERMHAADIDAGTREEQIRGRLKDSLECARTLYAQRASLEGPAAAALLDEHISAVLEAQSGSRFAHDLAQLVGHLGEASRRTAEAS
jgi:chromosome segregation ATPase